jgi:hypothetical protein
VVIPAVPLPKDGSIRTPVDFTLRPGWSFDAKRRTFMSSTGETVSPVDDVPVGSKIVYKAPGLARKDASTLNEHERAMRRYMQLILPAGESAARLLSTVRAWPPVEEASAGPEVSLPGGVLAPRPEGMVRTPHSGRPAPSPRKR